MRKDADDVDYDLIDDLLDENKTVMEKVNKKKTIKKGGSQKVTFY